MGTWVPMGNIYNWVLYCVIIMLSQMHLTLVRVTHICGHIFFSTVYKIKGWSSYHGGVSLPWGSWDVLSTNIMKDK